MVLLPKCRVLLSVSYDRDESNVGTSLGKLGRAVERLRRAGIKLLESCSAARADLIILLEEIVNTLADMVRIGLTYMALSLFRLTYLCLKEDKSSSSSILDTFFALSRISLEPSNAKTYNVAYDFLVRASTLATEMNEIRCLSGAFHNIAGTLYQCDKYAATVRFMREACLLGVRALELRRGSLGVPKGNEHDQKHDTWKLLEEQVFRRWELLGICYSKIGDRKVRSSLP
jgi:separase